MSTTTNFGWPKPADREQYLEILLQQVLDQIDADVAAAGAAVFDVRGFGATGDARKVADAVLNGTTTVTSAAEGDFTADDVGKVVYGVEISTGLLRVPVGTVTTVNSATSIEVSVAATGSYIAGTIWLVLGTDDSDAIRAAVTAAHAVNPKGLVYVPQGGYIFSKLLFDNRVGGSLEGVSVRGDGINRTVFFIHPDFDLATTETLKGLFSAITGCQNVFFDGFTVDGLGVALSGASTYHGAQFGGFGNAHVRDVHVTRFVGTASGVHLQQMNRGNVICLKADYNTGTNLSVAGAGVNFFDCFLSNGPGRAMLVSSIAGEIDNGNQIRFFGGLIDEHGAESVKINGSSTDVAFFGTKLWAGLGLRTVYVTDNSKVKFYACELTPYHTHTNVTALKVDAGSVVHLSGCRLKGTGSGYYLDNAGTVYDLGGNAFAGNLNGNALITQFDGVIRKPNGSISAPADSYTSETNSGWYRAGASDFRFSVAGTDRMTVTSGQFALGGIPLVITNGYVLTNSVYFSQDNGGYYSVGASNDTRYGRGAAAGRAKIMDASGNYGRLEMAASVTWHSGSGSPEGAVTASVGSLYTRTDGGAGTTLYVKESGSGNTGWVAK